MPVPRLGLPDLGIGVGLRTVHYQHLLTEQLVAARIDQVQQALGAPLVIENPSTYVAWQQSTLTE